MNKKVLGADSSRIERIAQAIANQEGFFVPGSLPARNRNPGDLRLDTIGRAVGSNGGFVVYRTDEDGWDALREQVRLMLTGDSAFYDPSMTISEVASLYAPGAQSAGWAQGVAGFLGVSVYTPIAEV